MKIKLKDFRVPAGKQVDLKKWPTRVKAIYISKKNYHKLLESQVRALSALQRLHYASNAAMDHQGAGQSPPPKLSTNPQLL